MRCPTSSISLRLAKTMSALISPVPSKYTLPPLPPSAPVGPRESLTLLKATAPLPPSPAFMVIVISSMSIWACYHKRPSLMYSDQDVRIQNTQTLQKIACPPRRHLDPARRNRDARIRPRSDARDRAHARARRGRRSGRPSPHLQHLSPAHGFRRAAGE